MVTGKLSEAATIAKYLRDSRGFDKAHVATTDLGTKYARVGCSQCQAICVNGVALHEQGCPNERFPEEDTSPEESDDGVD